MKNNYIIPIFVPHIGCPNDCVFCNQRKITGISTDITGEDVKSKIEDYLETIPEVDRNLEIAFFGGSFTGIDEPIQKEFLDIANSYKKMGIVNQIRLSTRPDYIDRNKLDILKERGVDIIELGVQSLDEEVIEKSNRGHNKECVYNAASLIHEYGFTLGVQMMIGLPGDTEEKAIKTAEELISLNPAIARIYPTLVVSETKLEEDFLSGNYVPLSLEEAVSLSKKLLLMFEKADVNVIRIGLQPSDNIADDGDISGGPFHPSFRQLVEEKVYFDIVDSLIDDYIVKFGRIENFENYLKRRYLIIEADPSLFSFISGQNRVNTQKLQEKYGLKGIKLKGISNDLSMEYKTYKIYDEDHTSKEVTNSEFNAYDKDVPGNVISRLNDLIRVYLDNNDKIKKKDYEKNLIMPLLESKIEIVKANIY